MDLFFVFNLVLLLLVVIQPNILLLPFVLELDPAIIIFDLNLFV